MRCGLQQGHGGRERGGPKSCVGRKTADGDKGCRGGGCSAFAARAWTAGSSRRQEGGEGEARVTVPEWRRGREGGVFEMRAVKKRLPWKA
eukprot:1595781-Rhodomonas_salina.1